MTAIYHITTPERWELAKAEGSYVPEMFPVDGFIHCSTRDQVVPVANLRFCGNRGLVLLCINPKIVSPRIVYENLEGGEQLFPHIYGALNSDAVVQVAKFQPGVDGYFSFPQDLEI